MELRQRAETAGVDEELVDAAMEADRPKAALIALLVQQQGRFGVVSFRQALSAEECDALVAAAELENRQYQGATTAGNDKARESEVRWLSRTHAAVLPAHAQFVQRTAAANAQWRWPLTQPEHHGLQLAKYVPPHGGYDWHNDIIASQASSGRSRTRMVTLVAQLSDADEYSGGDLQVGGVNASREKGTLHIFPSFLPHKVWPTTAGVRWSAVSWVATTVTIRPDRFNEG